ncbi:cobalamin biosynthesis protein CbiM [Halorhodospira abdelmalekii]|uniref:cobalt transporter CbiM n=1 Tax=Halorhodospira abdelmalekii TaxID=421629 RepID=UPI00190774BF|nr:cobalt transporter CbiM [Halorhodospira abdelmalekii]MBK1734471.1 cobalamin biosynthesis protein CbiM [Halorhodospira abdelmalekii]
MHLPDGLLPVGMAIGGYVGSAALLGFSLARIARLPDPGAAMPRAAMLTAIFFAVSSLAVPVPPTTVHPLLAGLMGVLLGWYAVPAILVGLFLQAVLFGHGGLTTLGLNGLILAPAALIAWGAWRALEPRLPTLAAVIAGSGGVVLSLAVFAAFVLLGLPAEVDAAAERAALALFLLAHLPLVLAEGVLVVVVLRVLARVEPGLLPRA